MKIIEERYIEGRRLESNIFLLPHILHTYFFSFEWVNKCLWSVECSVNSLEHSLHLCGFSP